MILIFLLVTIITLLALVTYKHMTIWKKRGAPQKFTPPIIGEMAEMMINKSTFAEWVTKMYNAFPNSRYVGTHQMGKPVLLIKDPDLIKQMCIKDFEHFLDHEKFLVDSDTDYVWSKSLFNLTGQKWKEMRSTLSPSFTSSKMRNLFVLMTKCGEDVADYFAKHGGEMEDLNMKDLFSRYANDVIASAAFGIHINSLEDKDNEFFLRGRNILQLKGFLINLKIMFMSLFPTLSRYLGLHFINQKTSSFFKNVVKQSVEYREKNNITRPDIINMLMQSGKDLDDEKPLEENSFAVVEEYLESKTQKNKKEKLSIEDIISQAFIFFLAGFETVSTLMSFVSYELAVNPDIQEKLQEEIDENRRNYKNLTYEAINKMTYLDMVISETLRKYPPSLVIDRVCTKPYKIEPKLDGESVVEIRHRDNIWIPIYGLHMDPKYYPNPEKFDPERFSLENKSDKPYYPFGIGPRNCIGSRFALLEAKAIFYHLLANFTIVPTKKSIIPLKFAKRSMTMDVEGGFYFGLKKR